MQGCSTVSMPLEVWCSEFVRFSGSINLAWAILDVVCPANGEVSPEEECEFSSSSLSSVSELIGCLCAMSNVLGVWSTVLSIILSVGRISGKFWFELTVGLFSFSSFILVLLLR